MDLAKTSLVAGILALALGLSSSARAGELFVEGSMGGQHAYSPTFDPFGRGGTPNVFSVGTLTVGYGLDDLIGMPGISALAVLGRTTVGTERFDGAYDFYWHRAHYLLGAEFARGFGPGSWVQPFVRLTAGIARQRVAVTPDGGPAFEQYRSPFAFRSSAGIDLHTPFGDGDGDGDPAFSLGENFALGGVFQLGYLMQPPGKFDALRASGHGEDDPWRRSGIDIGVLDADGWFWQFGASLRFRL